MGAGGLGLCQFPGPYGMELHRMVEKRPHRADRYNPGDGLSFRVPLQMPVHFKGISAAPVIVKYLYTLDLFRISGTADALDASLKVYVKEWVCSHPGPLRIVELILKSLYPKSMGYVLKLTLTALVAYGAFQRMGGKDQLHHHLPKFP